MGALTTRKDRCKHPKAGMHPDWRILDPVEGTNGIRCNLLKTRLTKKETPRRFHPTIVNPWSPRVGVTLPHQARTPRQVGKTTDHKSQRPNTSSGRGPVAAAAVQLASRCSKLGTWNGINPLRLPWLPPAVRGGTIEEGGPTNTPVLLPFLPWSNGEEGCSTPI